MVRRAMSRREFIRTSTVLGGTAALLGACGPGTSVTTLVGTTSGGTSGSTAATTATSAGGAVRGGTLTFATNANLRGLDPQKWWDGNIWSTSINIADSLLTTSPDGTLAANLAEVPEVSSDGTLYTFRLRPGVMFHHGREMTADDVKFSLDRLCQPEFACEGVSLYNGLPIVGLQAVVDDTTNEVSGIQVVDPLTLTIQLEEPDSALPYLMTLPFASVVPRDVVEEMGYEAFDRAPIATGAYTLQDVDLESGLRLERFADYWNPEEPHIDVIQWEMGVEPDLAALRIQDGQLDMMQPPPPIEMAIQLRDAPSADVQLSIEPVNLWYFFTLNVAQFEPFADINVRRAIAMAIDRDKLVRALRGLPQKAEGGLFSPQTPYYQSDIQIPFDPEGARALLAEAGFADGFEVEMLALGATSPSREMVESGASDLRDIGLSPIETIPVGGEFTERAYTGTPPPIVAYLWDLPYPHGSYFVDGAFTAASIEAQCCNLSIYQHPDVEELVQQGHLAQDSAELVEIYKEIDRIVVQRDVAVVPLFQDVRIEMMGPRVRGYFAPTTLSTAHFFKEYWLEDA